MAGLVQAICTSFKLDQLNAVHNFSSDTFMLALYRASTASLDSTTTAYTTTGEVAGPGYSAGGIPLSLLAGWPQIYGGVSAGVRFNDAVWAASTLSADGALLYNASKFNKSILIMPFPATIYSSNSTFTVGLSTTVYPVIYSA